MPTTFRPLLRMLESVEVARSETDVSLFLQLLYLGEMLTKTAAAGLVAAVTDDRDRHRYRQLHRLVRANSLGDWSNVIDEVLAGPASQFLSPKARDLQKELTQRCNAGSWQHEAATALHGCVKIVDVGFDPLPVVIDGRRIFSLFVALRNRTRGHGATQGDTCSRLCVPLERALRLVIDNFSLLSMPWAFLHRNLSGKYRVTALTDNVSSFADFKTGTSHTLTDGIYLYLDASARVDLITSTADSIDFFYANGGFKGKQYEAISYLTDTKLLEDATPYLAPPTELPPSETQGMGTLEIHGHTFANLPQLPDGHIRRFTLESELRSVLMDDRHPIVTLAGRGGIGKTSLALSVLHQVVNETRFAAVLWFSGRDIDLLPQGPKLVRPQVVTSKDIAEEFVALLQPAEVTQRDFKPLRYFESALTSSPVGPILFVIDNFETVRPPAEVFHWLDTCVRSPNKILITTRVREFRGDFPIEVLGMTEEEFDRLVDATASPLRITRFLTTDYRQELYRESDGHPYVVKILLGEVAKAQRAVRVERIVASQDAILDALFERTFATLSPAAKRILLTLCHWRSTVPKIAVEAVMLRPAVERLDVDAAIDELAKASFVETRTSAEDRETFLVVPLVAAIFGKKKLTVSELKSAVEADTELLQAFGAAQPSDIRHGVAPRIQRLFRYVASRVTQPDETLEPYLPMLEFIASKYPPAWLLLADLHEESISPERLQQAKAAVRRSLETPASTETQQAAWDRLADLCREDGDSLGEVHALVEMAVLPGTPFRLVSNAANRLNGAFSMQHVALDTFEKQALVRRLVEAMERRLDEADATDCSRLAWLTLHLGDQERASRFIGQGLRLDANNDHCFRLARRLGIL
jgi:NB-ARC domain